MKKEPSVILPISLPSALCAKVKSRATEKHGKRSVSRYTRKLYEADLAKK